MARKIVLNVIDDSSTTESDTDEIQKAHRRSEMRQHYASFREMYYNTPQYTGRRQATDNGNVASSVSNEREGKTESKREDAASTAEKHTGSDMAEKRQVEHHDIDSSSETEEIVAPSNACSTISVSSTLGRRAELKPHRIQSISTVSKNSGYRKFEFQQFNTGYPMSHVVYIKDSSCTKLATTPPKPSYSNNSNAKQAEIVSSAKTAGLRPSTSVLFRSNVRPANLVLEGGPHFSTLSSIKTYIDIERIKDIVSSAVSIIRTSSDMSRFKINSTSYISLSHRDFSKGMQDINLINSSFYRSVFVMQSLSTLVYYAYNGTAHIVFHDRTRILINKNYTSYNILVFTHDKSLSQESINAQNGITYHTNGIIVETPRETTQIILPNSVVVKSNVHIMDCFIVWRF